MLEIYIKKIRKEKNLTQEQLAKLSGVSASHIGYIENGTREPTISVLCKIANALDVQVDDLYKFTF